MEIFKQNDGEVTKAYYSALGARGIAGQLAVALFRAQKRSTAAKRYRGRRFKSAAYDVKNWSISEICRLAAQQDDIIWGWQKDEDTPGFEWVLYVDLPTGQCSFHSAIRLQGPEYPGKWDGIRGQSEMSILAFCDSLAKIFTENNS